MQALFGRSKTAAKSLKAKALSRGVEPMMKPKLEKPKHQVPTGMSKVTFVSARCLPLLSTAQISGASAEMIGQQYGHLLGEAAFKASATLWIGKRSGSNRKPVCVMAD